MQAILDFFAGFAEAIVGVINFVISMVKDILYLIELTALFLSQIPTYFAWLPSQFVTTLILIFTVVVLYKILGREG